MMLALILEIYILSNLNYNKKPQIDVLNLNIKLLDLLDSSYESFNS